ncbi:MAG: hypothetical protein ABI969_16895, partial [bacterium]
VMSAAKDLRGIAQSIAFVVGAYLAGHVLAPIRSALERDAGINAFQWAHAALHLRAAAALAEIERLEADSKFLRSLCTALFQLLPIFLRSSAPHRVGWTRKVRCA